MKPVSIRFTKMHGLGNDFVVIDAVNQSISLQELSFPTLSDRHVGIGFDQLLVIEPSTSADFFCRIFNADGSEAEQCGNGLRCIARFLHEQKLITNNSVQIETKAGIFPIDIENYDRIRVTLGTPTDQEVPMKLALSSLSSSISINTLSLGNPHAIVKVDSVDTVPAHTLGAEISTHTIFPNGVNVGFMQIVNPNHIRLRTFERGVGETHACGSNACAAACVGIMNGWLEYQVKVEFRYGSLWIEWEGNGKPIYMTGPASRVFSGEIMIK